MRLTALGCDGGITGPRRTSCYLVDDDILIDVGTGAGELSLEQAVAIDTVFLSHAHLDHCCLLPMLADAAGNFRHTPLTVYALPQTIATLRAHLFNGLLWPDYTRLPTVAQPYLRFVPLQLGETVALAGRRITALPARHALPCIGYQLDSGAASLAYSADTTYCPEFWQALDGIDNLAALLIENTFLEANTEAAAHSGHMTAAQLARGMASLRHAPELYIVHREPGREAETMREIVAAAGRFAPKALQRGQTLTF